MFFTIGALYRTFLQPVFRVHRSSKHIFQNIKSFKEPTY